MNKSLYLTSLLIIICITFSACNREKVKSNEAKTANTTTEEKSSTTSTTNQDAKPIDGANTHSETKEASNSNNNNTSNNMATNNLKPLSTITASKNEGSIMKLKIRINPG